jgi:hypothetical protein
VLPSGLATDHGSGPLRRLLFSRSDVDAIVGIDNRRGVFPIHRSVRFLLVTASAAEATSSIACRLDLDDPAQLEALGDEPVQTSAWFPVRLTPTLLERVSGPDLAIPAVRTGNDLAIVERAAALFRPLGSPDGWAVHFGRELNASDDRADFRPRTGSAGLPILEGKHLEPFHVAVEKATQIVSRADARRHLRDERYDRPRLAYRDVASATNRLTLIAAVLPGGCVSTHTIFCLRTALPSRAQYFLCGLFNSLLLNYFVRMRVTTHVTTGIVERLPVPRPDEAPGAFREIAALARTLTRGRNPDAFARLNAIAARLYQLTVAEFEHVLRTFPLVDAEERAAALRCFVDMPTRR